MADRRLQAWPVVVVVAFAAWLVWPVPLGRMPLSADHTVHLARIAMTGHRLLESGSLSGWEPTWFFGFPLGDLYPPLGDLLVIAIRGLGLGLLDWPQAYALGFFVVFATQGLVMVRTGRLFGLGPWPGLIAGLLLLGDPGFTREGGWMYTVQFGVWPQALATSLVWLGFGELALGLGWRASRSLDADPIEAPSPLRACTRAGVALAGGLLAHPIALPSLVIGIGLMAVTMLPRANLEWRRGLARLIFAGAVAVVLASWWWVPMLQHKAWMASYGWLYAPLDAMTTWLVDDGRWATRMPPAVGWLAATGMVLAAVPWRDPSKDFLRFVAACSLIQWLLASSDVYWQLRLDRFSEGFAHLQWQRFLIAAKPGLYLCAGAAIVVPIGLARRIWTRPLSRPLRVGLVSALTLASAGAAAWMVGDQRAAMAEHAVGNIELDRMPTATDPAAFETDYQHFLVWAEQEWRGRDRDYRIAVRESRNLHWFMDAPVWLDTPIYKLGFTPGDNFVHKPEQGRPEVLDALGVRFVLARSRTAVAQPGEVARFGSLVVREHRGGARGLAWIDGPGTVEVVAADLRAGTVRVRVAETNESSRLVFGIAGYPRWQATLDGEAIEWFEVPVWGDAEPVTQAERRSGRLRGGKALGDDGSEPTLLAIDLPAGAGDAEIELVYDEHTGAEIVAELLSVAGLLGIGFVGFGGTRASVARVRMAVESLVEVRLPRLLHPILLAGAAMVALLGAGNRWNAGEELEAERLVGRAIAGEVAMTGAEPGPVKTEMLIRPALLLRPRPDSPAELRFDLTEMPTRLRGWLGIDDDQAKHNARWGRHRVRIEARRQGTNDPWSTLADVQIKHAPGRVMLDIATDALAGQSVEVRVVDRTEGRPVPLLGLDLELSAGEPLP